MSNLSLNISNYGWTKRTKKINVNGQHHCKKKKMPALENGERNSSF